MTELKNKERIIAIEAGKFSLDEWTKIYLAPTAVAFELKPTGSTFRGMNNLDNAKAYADKVSDFFKEHNLHKQVFVVQGPTSTTKAKYEVVTETAGYSIMYRTQMLPQEDLREPVLRRSRP